MPSIFIVFVFYCISVVLSAPNTVIVPCKKSDEDCMIRSANIAAKIIAAGIPSLGVEGFEPAHVNEISGQVSNFIFNFTENAVAGYSRCDISDVKLNLKAWKLKFDITCPSLEATGHLVVSGELLDVPVVGDDDYYIFSGKYLIKVDADIEKTKGADGREHLAITTFKHRGVPYEPFQFQYGNFKPNKELSPRAAAAFEERKFFKAVELISETYINTLYKEAMFKSVNKFLERVPFEDLFID